MCIDAPESTTNSRSFGLVEVGRHYLCLNRSIERGSVRILELVNMFRQISRCFAGASFLVQGLLMWSFPDFWRAKTTPGLHSDHVQQWTLSNYHWMERAYHGCSPVWRTTCPGSLVRSDPELQHFFSVFQHSPESRPRDTGFVFALRSWWITVTCPSRHPSSASKAMKKLADPLWPSRCFLFLLGWTDKISRGTHSELLWWSGVPTCPLKYLTPSAALRGSRSRSPWYISASPTVFWVGFAKRPDIPLQWAEAQRFLSTSKKTRQKSQEVREVGQVSEDRTWGKRENGTFNNDMSSEMEMGANTRHKLLFTLRQCGVPTLEKCGAVWSVHCDLRTRKNVRLRASGQVWCLHRQVCSSAMYKSFFQTCNSDTR